MKRVQLLNAGVPEGCVNEAIASISYVARHGNKSDLRKIPQTVKAILASPEEYTKEKGSLWYKLAEALLYERRMLALQAARGPVRFEQWGSEIDPKALHQMYNACEIPVARKAAVMPDAHVGYGVPIGCVLATENAVIPNAVGVDIACRMKLSVLALAPEFGMIGQSLILREALMEETRFGLGCEFDIDTRRQHAVMDEKVWSELRILKSVKDMAARQLGTSGGGNHFVEFGILTVDEANVLGLSPGRYLALMSHSGSRGMGSKIATEFHRIAKEKLPRQFKKFRDLAWLDLHSDAGEQYWTAMNLAGRYASANHDCIHAAIVKRLGTKVLVSVENHHNFAWKENHDGTELIVHRKGATPAFSGDLGVIPGSMADPAFVVVGKGNPDSLCSASHGAGRKMSRTQAKYHLDQDAALEYLEAKGVQLLSAGVDELPGVYKDIEQVMSEQTDLVDTLARFDPKIVRMAGSMKLET